ncbi:hypothetical protein DFJ77DRAFT_466078 [Powellomyces hirtus]|nr:hypothetical protein DFJ77DRAFT_466078 [Powellomyces hirtus]
MLDTHHHIQEKSTKQFNAKVRHCRNMVQIRNDQLQKSHRVTSRPTFPRFSQTICHATYRRTLQHLPGLTLNIQQSATHRRQAMHRMRQKHTQTKYLQTLSPQQETRGNYSTGSWSTVNELSDTLKKSHTGSLSLRVLVLWRWRSSLKNTTVAQPVIRSPPRNNDIYTPPTPAFMRALGRNPQQPQTSHTLFKSETQPQPLSIKPEASAQPSPPAPEPPSSGNHTHTDVSGTTPTPTNSGWATKKRGRVDDEWEDVKRRRVGQPDELRGYGT